MELEQKGISSLLFRERTMKPSHSEIIVDLLRKAIGKDLFNTLYTEQNKSFSEYYLSTTMTIY